jgi:hypothetical protein
MRSLKHRRFLADEVSAADEVSETSPVIQQTGALTCALWYGAASPRHRAAPATFSTQSADTVGQSAARDP